MASAALTLQAAGMQLQMNPGSVHRCQLHLNTVFHPFFCPEQHTSQQCLLGPTTTPFYPPQ